jgi:alpha-L-fucosidase 2
LLELLPAPLPEWPDGKVCGLRARGGLTVDLSWQDSRLNQATLLPDNDMEIAYAGGILKLTAGIPVTING